jgi:hypothetical protein
MRIAKHRSIGAAGLAAALWLGALPAAAHPTVDVANPQPGDRVIAGSVIMEGLAWDHDARDGSGVERVWVRVCGVGGAFLGDATLGMPSTSSVKNGSRYILNAGWRINADLRGAGEARELCITARSSVTGTDTLVRVPITIGTAPPAPPAPTTDICRINPEECGPNEPEPGPPLVTVGAGETGTTGGTGGTSAVTAPATGGSGGAGTTSGTGGTTAPATGGTGGAGTTGGTGGSTNPGTGGIGGTGTPGSGGPTDPCVIDPEDPICP